jgi:hypothetical protein
MTGKKGEGILCIRIRCTGEVPMAGVGSKVISAFVPRDNSAFSVPSVVESSERFFTLSVVLGGTIWAVFQAAGGKQGVSA